MEIRRRNTNTGGLGCSTLRWDWGDFSSQFLFNNTHYGISLLSDRTREYKAVIREMVS